LYFVAFEPTYGLELWKTDGTDAGTVIVKNINTSGNSDPQQLTLSVNIPGDFDSDGNVDTTDLGIFRENWLTNNRAIDIAPSGGDGIVNMLDFAVFAANWLAGD
jgi:ELWxxDGT repeat protein